MIQQHAVRAAALHSSTSPQFYFESDRIVYEDQEFQLELQVPIYRAHSYE